ncbi:polypyrimidine tract-binding protein homolog 1-like isoform X2 [Diospyros lotus]|uniref:polypyrimidine tract-binding protein homolog 1-like isoform X2 n=1 Tax=Diospyros lotus TaxID=55363 RepID=UPI002257EFA8|nr:polypyrimidine tract-binding protein homolog 1-like isoform X2 [Diospyros lotus]
MSTSGQHQFRYTQTPSKVLHMRNLPWECIEEELVELCKPFGKIINTKCNVGANRNQAFVEFADLNQAINMVTYFASSSEPALIRGKNVYIQYSNRNEIVNNKSPGDTPGNVLLVTIEGVGAGDVSIDVIHLVFSAFGFVHKIATFEKAAGFQALIQYTDVQTAASAREALDGRSIPRDYTNPYLPVNPTAIEGFVQPTVGLDVKRMEPEGNVLLASIENMQYAVTVDVLHTVFSAFGTVHKIAIFEKNGGTQALIQYPDVAMAAVAKNALEGHCIYDGGYCKLHLTYSRHSDLNIKAYSDKSRDYTAPESGLVAIQQAPGATTATPWQNPQASPMFPRGEFPADGAVPAQAPGSQVPSWDPNMGAGRPTFVSVPNAFHGQMYPPASAPDHVTAATPAASLPPVQIGQMSPTLPSSGVSQRVGQANVRPGGSLPPGQPSYYH